MTIENERPDRWGIARRVYECAGLSRGDLAALMGVSLKVLDAMSQIMTAAGILYAIYGRVVATRRISI